MSGYTEHSLADGALAIPNSVFLPKPFSLSDLIACVENQLTGRPPVHARMGRTGDLAQREGTVLRGLRVVGDDLFVVRDDNEARAELHHRGRNAQLLELVQQVALGFAEVDDVLLRHLALRIVGHVEGTVAQAGHVAFRPTVGEEEIEDDLAVIVLSPSEGLDAFFNRLEVQSCHVRFPFSCQRLRESLVEFE